MSRHASLDLAARAFVRQGKRLGTVTVVGGGWWHIAGLSAIPRLPERAHGLRRAPLARRDRGGLLVQGLAALALVLECNGRLVRLPEGGAELRAQ